MLCLGDLRGDDRDMLVTLSVCLLVLSGSPSERTVQVGEGLDLRYCPSPGFHQKVGIRSLQERVSFLARVVIQSRIPLIPASIVLVYDLICVLL